MSMKNLTSQQIQQLQKTVTQPRRKKRLPPATHMRILMKNDVQMRAAG